MRSAIFRRGWGKEPNEQVQRGFPSQDPGAFAPDPLGLPLPVADKCPLGRIRQHFPGVVRSRHKRLLESRRLGDNQTRLHAALSGIKHEVDTAVLGSRQLLDNLPFFERSVMPIVVRHFRDHPPEPDADTRQRIQQLLVREYLAEAQGELPYR